jgi:hypothetical protein
MTPNPLKPEDLGLPPLERYKMMREEVMLYIRETYRLEGLAIVTVGAFYAWLESHKSDVSIPGFIWYLPCLIIAFAGARCFFFTEELIRIGEYLRAIEEEVFGKAKAKCFGWDSFKSVKIKNRDQHDRRSRLIAFSAWIIVFHISIGISWLESRHLPFFGS